MTTQHTPGPWNYSGPCEITGRYSIFHNGPLAYCADTTAKPGDGEANARLIAAAPDLLELARQIVLAAEQNEGSIPADIVSGAVAAIAKATGENA